MSRPLRGLQVGRHQRCGGIEESTLADVQAQWQRLWQEGAGQRPPGQGGPQVGHYQHCGGAERLIQEYVGAQRRPLEQWELQVDHQSRPPSEASTVPDAHVALGDVIGMEVDAVVGEVVDELERKEAYTLE